MKILNFKKDQEWAGIPHPLLIDTYSLMLPFSLSLF